LLKITNNSYDPFLLNLSLLVFCTACITLHLMADASPYCKRLPCNHTSVDELYTTMHTKLQKIAACRPSFLISAERRSAVEERRASITASKATIIVYSIARSAGKQPCSSMSPPFLRTGYHFSLLRRGKGRVGGRAWPRRKYISIFFWQNRHFNPLTLF